MTDNKREKGAFLRCDYCATICHNPLILEIKNSTLYCCQRNECKTFIQNLVPQKDFIIINDPCDNCHIREKTNAIEENNIWYLLCQSCSDKRFKK
jgi:hypothetical protein